MGTAEQVAGWVTQDDTQKWLRTFQRAWEQGEAETDACGGSGGTSASRTLLYDESRDLVPAEFQTA